MRSAAIVSVKNSLFDTVYVRYLPILVIELLMGQLDEITLEGLYELKEQIDEGKPRELFSRRLDASRATNWIRWLNAMVSSRKRSATGSIGSSSNRSSKLHSTLLDQEAQQRLPDKIVSSSSISFNSRQPNSVTSNKRGQPNSWVNCVASSAGIISLPN
jgi:hypothetical protein